MRRRDYCWIVVGMIALTAGILRAQRIDISNRPLRSERSRSFDVLHYRIDLNLDWEQKRLNGATTITLTPFDDGLDTCVLDAETFTVTDVVRADSKHLKFDQSGGHLTVTLGSEYAFDDTISFTVLYEATDPQPDSEKFGMSATYALGLRFIDATEGHPEIVQTLSWPEGARHWFPCYDHPNDKATHETIVTVRDDFKVLSNGRLDNITENPENGTKTHTWVQDKPHPTYLHTVIAGPFEVLKDSLGSLPVNYWVLPKDVDDAMRSFHKTPEILAFFENTFESPYPWDKYDQITIPGVGGGAEATTATLLGLRTIHDERADQDFPSHWLVAHEAAHQWWGNFVTLRDWGHTWINESFGTYCEYLFSAHDLGKDEGALNLLNKKNQYFREANTRYMRPIVTDRWNYPADNFDSHTYPKGACVLHMMRWILGDGPFFRTCTHFLREHAYGPADTHDFLTAVKEITGRNFGWFFDQWLMRPGHPVFEVHYEWDAANKHIVLYVTQTQDTTLGIPVYRTPVVIGVTTPSGRTSHRIWIEESKHTFSLPCEVRPLMVRFDEGNFLLKEWSFEKSTDELLYQLVHDDAIGRAWAASQLSDRQERVMITALKSSARKDEFWAVRREAIKALGILDATGHTSFLKKACLDPNSRVREAALDALGDLSDMKLAAFFLKRFSMDDSYVAQAEALRALGKCGDVSLIPVLKEARETDSPRDILRRAANWALEALQK